MPPIVSQSNDPKYDKLLGSDLCGHAPAGAYQDRCGHGPRLPLLVISPHSKTNFSLNHSITDRSSILRFIEDNWGLSRIGNQSFDGKAGSYFEYVRLLSKRAEVAEVLPSTLLQVYHAQAS